MEWITNMFWEMIVCVLGVVLTAVGTRLATLLGELFKEKLAQSNVQSIAKASVAAVEMIYREAGGSEKLEKAIEMAQNLMEEKGIEMKEGTLRIWLEAALAEWKGAFEKA